MNNSDTFKKKEMIQALEDVRRTIDLYRRTNMTPKDCVRYIDNSIGNLYGEYVLDRGKSQNVS